MNVSGKHSSLLQHRNYYVRKKFYSTGPLVTNALHCEPGLLDKAGNTNLRERLSVADRHIKAACFVQK